MVVVAHPDDEILGVGGTINKLVNNLSAEIKVLILGEGITSRDNDDENQIENKLTIHQQNILDAKFFLGYQSLSTHKLPDNRFDSVPLLDIIKIVENEKKVFNPEVVFTHHSGDLNIDHRITFQSVLTAFRPIKNENTKMIITFETLSGTEWTSPTDSDNFNPNLFIQLDNFNMQNKLDAMECYVYEKRNFPHPRSSKSIKNKAITRGVSVGYEYAEAFQIIRLIID